MHILHTDSSAAGDLSFSRRGSAALVAALRARNEDATVTYRDLAASPLPHIGGSFRGSWAVAPDQRTPEHLAAIAHSEGLSAELKAADVLVIGAPMYNFSVPSTRKAWTSGHHRRGGDADRGCRARWRRGGGQPGQRDREGRRRLTRRAYKNGTFRDVADGQHRSGIRGHRQSVGTFGL